MEQNAFELLRAAAEKICNILNTSTGKILAAKSSPNEKE